MAWGCLHRISVNDGSDHVICPDQSETSLQITWSASTNHRWPGVSCCYSGFPAPTPWSSELWRKQQTTNKHNHYSSYRAHRAGQQKHSETNHQREKHIIHYTLYCSVLLEFMMVDRFREHQVFLVPVKHWWSLIMTRLADDRVKPKLTQIVLYHDDLIWTCDTAMTNRDKGDWD